MKITEMSEAQRVALRDDLEPLLGQSIDSADAGALELAMSPLVGTPDFKLICSAYGLSPDEFEAQPDGDAEGEGEELDTNLIKLADDLAAEWDELAAALAAEDFNALGRALKAVDDQPVPATKPERIDRATILFAKLEGADGEPEPEEAEEAASSDEGKPEAPKVDEADEKAQPDGDAEAEGEELDARPKKAARGKNAEVKITDAMTGRCYLLQCNPPINGVYRGDILINPAPEIEAKIRGRLPHTLLSVSEAKKYAGARAGRINRAFSRLDALEPGDQNAGGDDDADTTEAE